MEYKVKLGVVGTRRNIFSKEDALKYKALILDKLRDMNVELVDIDDINEEGLLFSDEHVQPVVDKLTREKVDALFFPHCNFGTEDLVAKVAKNFNLPILLWGPKDEAPLENGARLRDSQCGLFATGKILRRFRMKFTYLPMCRIDDREFEEGINRFIATSNIVKEVKNLTILQISTRPAGFWTMMVNEGELLEKFNVKIHPVTMVDIQKEMNRVVEENGEELQNVVQYMKETMTINVSEDGVKRTAGLKIAMKNFAVKFGCSGVAIQCWNSMQDALGIFPCVANSLLSDEGIPVACETDVHGVISSIIAQAATMGKIMPFFADWTVPHPTNPNGELLQHCGPWPISLMKGKPSFGAPFAFNHSHPGALHGELKGGDMSIIRFDGDNGEYSILMGHAKGIEGPFNQGTYVWIEVENLKKLEEKIVCGPYVHHCVGVHKDVLPQIYEACKYLGDVTPDFYDNIEEEIKAQLRGE